MLQPLGPDIWTIEGPAVTAFLGFRYPTRMALVRLQDGGLFVWSPIALTEALRDAVAGVGPVRHIVAPNDLHHLSVPNWMAAWPQAQVHAAPGLRAKRPDIAFTADLADTPPPGWAGQIDQAVIRGNAITTEVVFFHRASGTVLVTDLIQHLPRGWYTGWRALVARLDLMTGPEPAVPRKFRMAFKDKATARAAMRPVLDWPAQALLIAHGPPVTQDAQATLRRAFDWLPS
ncbi:DUF4336 domain-containing protein [Zavarzinia sp. CC-PAN008]|uniref:DUF4336 domain-containing protein n=1 Tax=Zavarzinia sp. CC-PAN008 TaxID=3243332 RepID=UPI003F743D4B